MDINSKGIAAIVLAIVAKETGEGLNSSSAEGDQEAWTNRFSRLTHIPRLAQESLAYRHRATRLAGLLAGL